MLRAAEAADIRLIDLHDQPEVLLRRLRISTGLLDTRTTALDSLDGHRVLTNPLEAVSRSSKSINRE